MTRSIATARWHGRRRRAPVVALLAAAAAIWGCGSDDAFTAEELLAELNERGGALVLGESLSTSQEDVEIFSLSFRGGSSAPATAPGAVDVHGGGSLTVTSDDEAGLAEYERCEAAVSLVCFRVENAVLAFEGAVAPSDLDRLERAIRSLAG